MWKLRNEILFRASVLTRGFLAWTGRVAVDSSASLLDVRKS